MTIRQKASWRHVGHVGRCRLATPVYVVCWMCGDSNQTPGVNYVPVRPGFCCSVPALLVSPPKTPTSIRGNLIIVASVLPWRWEAGWTTESEWVHGNQRVGDRRARGRRTDTSVKRKQQNERGLSWRKAGMRSNKRGRKGGGWKRNGARRALAACGEKKRRRS